MNARRPSVIAIALAIVALGVTATMNLAAVSQSTQGSNDAMAALLSEVHALRLAMEKSAAVTPRVQLTLARLNIEEQRTARLGAQLEQVRRQLSESVLESQRTSDELAEYDKRLQTESDSPVKTALERERVVLARRLGEQNATQQQLRLRENEAAQLFSAEQSRWVQLNDRLDELERLLAPVR
jgi:hypothetical protein